MGEKLADTTPPVESLRSIVRPPRQLRLQPPVGSVQIRWRGSHGVQHFGQPANPFNATAPGATWQYQLQDVTAPLLVSVIHQPGFSVRSLSQIEVHFSEPVPGVDAGDLRI